MRALVLAVVLSIAGVAAAPSPAFAEPPDTHEIIYNRPSGFWTSNRPAVGGAYRYRLLGIGCAIALGMGWLIYRTIKKANAARRDAPPAWPTKPTPAKPET